MSRKTPFHLVQLDAGSGLDLIADYLDREPLYSEEGGVLPGPEEYPQAPYPILSRIGLDPAPAPDVSELYSTLSRDPAGPKLHRCAGPDMPAFIAGKIEPKPDEGLLVFSKGGEFDDGFRRAMRDVLALWGEVGFWAESAGELRVHRWVEGGLKSAALARVDGERLVLLKGWNFLQPSGPVKPQRMTIEEPPRKSAF